MAKFRLRGCSACGGDLYELYEDGDWSWHCILCARDFDHEKGGIRSGRRDHREIDLDRDVLERWLSKRPDEAED